MNDHPTSEPPDPGYIEGEIGTKPKRTHLDALEDIASQKPGLKAAVEPVATELRLLRRLLAESQALSSKQSKWIEDATNEVARLRSENARLEADLDGVTEPIEWQLKLFVGSRSDYATGMIGGPGTIVRPAWDAMKEADAALFAKLALEAKDVDKPVPGLFSAIGRAFRALGGSQ